MNCSATKMYCLYCSNKNHNFSSYYFHLLQYILIYSYIQLNQIDLFPYWLIKKYWNHFVLALVLKKRNNCWWNCWLWYALYTSLSLSDYYSQQQRLNPMNWISNSISSQRAAVTMIFIHYVRLYYSLNLETFFTALNIYWV